MTPDSQQHWTSFNISLFELSICLRLQILPTPSLLQCTLVDVWALVCLHANVLFFLPVHVLDFFTNVFIKIKKRKRKVKGVHYEDDKEEGGEEDHPELVPDSNGRAKWRMEVNSTIGLGVSQSQIMDAG